MVFEKRPAKPPRTAATGRSNIKIPIISMTSETDPKPGQALLSPPTIGQLFTTFAAISLSGFGGVLAWARRILVEQRRWLTADQFNETFALCSFLPGGNIVNFCLIFATPMPAPPPPLAPLRGL